MYTTNLGMPLLVISIVCSVAALTNKSCETPNSPENGFVTVSKDDPTLAVYLCSSGYVLNGQAHRVCASNGEWKGRAPSCLLETKESSSHLATMIGGLLGGSAILGLTAGVAIYFIKRRNCNFQPNLNCLNCPRYIHDNRKDQTVNAFYVEGNNSQCSQNCPDGSQQADIKDSAEEDECERAEKDKMLNK